MNYATQKDDHEIIISAALPAWHDGTAEADDRMVSELIRDGAPEWIDQHFDQSGVMDGVWWVSKNNHNRAEQFAELQECISDAAYVIQYEYENNYHGYSGANALSLYLRDEFSINVNSDDEAARAFNNVCEGTAWNKA